MYLLVQSVQQVLFLSLPRQDPLNSREYQFCFFFSLGQNAIAQVISLWHYDHRKCSLEIGGEL